MSGMEWYGPQPPVLSRSPLYSVTSSMVPFRQVWAWANRAFLEQRVQHHSHDGGKGGKSFRLTAGNGSTSPTIGKSSDKGSCWIQAVQILQMLRQSNHKAFVVNIELRVKIVINIPKPVSKLIKRAVGTGDCEPAFIGKFDPAVVGNHVAVVAGVAVQSNDQRKDGLNILGNMNAILPAQPIVLKRDVLPVSTQGQKKDGETAVRTLAR